MCRLGSMVNLWLYENIGEIRVTKTDGSAIVGYALSVNDSDETESGEVEINVENPDWPDGTIVGLRNSEIQSVEVLA